MKRGRKVIKVCCISDTHERHRRVELPECDLLLHAGDLTFQGSPGSIKDFNEWCGQILKEGKAREIVCIAGNHDFVFQTQPRFARSLITNARYLEDGPTAFEGLKIYGTPWQPWFYDWAFNLKTEEELKQKFNQIPRSTDILLCHTPPLGILDTTYLGRACGSSSLLRAVYRVRPKLVVFGHIHESYGLVEREGIVFVNASSCDMNYQPVNPPHVIELPLPPPEQK